MLCWESLGLIMSYNPYISFQKCRILEKVNVDLRGVGKNFGLLLVGLRTGVLLP